MNDRIFKALSFIDHMNEFFDMKNDRYEKRILVLINSYFYNY